MAYKKQGMVAEADKTEKQNFFAKKDLADANGKKRRLVKMKTKLGHRYLRRARGPELSKEVWNDLFIKYRTGEYTMTALSEEFGIDLSVVSRMIRSYGIEKDPNAQQAIQLFDEGFKAISNIVNGENKAEKERMEQMAAEVMTDEKMGENRRTDLETPEHPVVVLEKVTPPKTKKEKRQDLVAKKEALECEVIDNANSVKLANEIMDIVAKRNPQFARGFQIIGAIMIEKMKDILRSPKLISGDIRNIAQAMKDLDSTMGIFPKQPTIAQQFNFGQKNKEKEIDTDINLQISVVGKSDKSE